MREHIVVVSACISMFAIAQVFPDRAAAQAGARKKAAKAVSTLPMRPGYYYATSGNTWVGAGDTCAGAMRSHTGLAVRSRALEISDDATAIVSVSRLPSGDYTLKERHIGGHVSTSKVRIIDANSFVLSREDPAGANWPRLTFVYKFCSPTPPRGWR